MFHVYLYSIVFDLEYKLYINYSTVLVHCATFSMQCGAKDWKNHFWWCHVQYEGILAAVQCYSLSPDLHCNLSWSQDFWYRNIQLQTPHWSSNQRVPQLPSDVCSVAFNAFLRSVSGSCKDCCQAAIECHVALSSCNLEPVKAAQLKQKTSRNFEQVVLIIWYHINDINMYQSDHAFCTGKHWEVSEILLGQSNVWFRDPSNGKNM